MLVWFKPTFKLERWKLMSKMCLHVTIMKDNLNSVRQMGRKIIVKFNNCTNNHYHVFMGEFLSCIYTKYALNNQRTQNTIMQNSRSTKYKISTIKKQKNKKKEKERKKKLKREKNIKVTIIFIIIIILLSD